MAVIILGLIIMLYEGVEIHKNIKSSIDNYDRDRQCQTSDIAYYVDAKDLSKCKPIQNP